MDVLTMSWSDTCGLPGILTVCIGGVEFICPKPVSLVSTNNGGEAVTISFVSAA
jgi:hypothetical protein